MICLSENKILNKPIKGERLLKHPKGQILTILFTEENIREDIQPLQTTLRRSALASARETMQDSGMMLRLVKTYACSIALSISQRNAKYFGNFRENMQPNGHTKDPAQVARANMAGIVSSSPALRI